MKSDPLCRRCCSLTLSYQFFCYICISSRCPLNFTSPSRLSFRGGIQLDSLYQKCLRLLVKFYIFIYSVKLIFFIWILIILRKDASVSESERGEKRRERYHTVPFHRHQSLPTPRPRLL